MGFIPPTPPPVDVAGWKSKPHLSRIRPLAQDWAINGFGTPTAICLVYVLKLVVFSVGGILYRLRPGTVRLPPWPDRVPLTRGTRRSVADVTLHAGVLASAVYLLFSDGEPAAGIAAGRLDPTAVAVLLGFLVLLGLRDKVSFLAARPEVYGDDLAAHFEV